MTTFKVGDKVRRKPGMMNGWPYGDKVLTVGATKDSRGYEYLGFDEVYPGYCEWEPGNFDLVTEAKPRPQAGEYWRQRDGEVVGPLKVHERSGAIYLGYRIDPPLYWATTGVWEITRESPKDLIERVDVCAHCGQPTVKTV